MRTIHEVRRCLVAAARRHSRVRDEAEDLAHDLLVSALRRGLPLEDDGFARSAFASARRHAAFVARSAARRRARELVYTAELPFACEAQYHREAQYHHEAQYDREAEGADRDEAGQGDGAAPARLPAALHTTLLLLSLGHTKAELRALLGLTDAALRKRLQGLRERAPLGRPQFAQRSAGSPEQRRTQVRIAQQLAHRPEARGGARLIALSDAEGHGIIFSELLTNAPGAATPTASAPALRSGEALVKGKTC